MGDARRRLLADFRQFDEADCPLCHRHLVVQRRHISRPNALVLVAMSKQSSSYVHVPKLTDRLGLARTASDFTTVGVAFGLIKPLRGRDGSLRRGWHRLTAKGAEFVADERSLPRFAYTYNGGVLRFGGPRIRIDDALAD